jgi:hypothetical protein
MSSTLAVAENTSQMPAMHLGDRIEVRTDESDRWIVGFVCAVKPDLVNAITIEGQSLRKRFDLVHEDDPRLATITNVFENDRGIFRLAANETAMRRLAEKVDALEKLLLEVLQKNRKKDP